MFVDFRILKGNYNGLKFCRKKYFLCSKVFCSKVKFSVVKFTKVHYSKHS